MNAFWIALQFLTILPTAKKIDYNGQDLGKAILYYPLVGLLIAGLLYANQFLLFQVFTELPHAPELVAALTLTVWVAVSGGLHLDGLADCADAWVGGLGDKEKTLQILKDPRSGPIAVVTLVLTLLLKYACLLVIFTQQNAVYLFLIPFLARGSLFLFFLTLPYARSEGIAATMHKRFPRQAGWWVLFLIVTCVVFIKTQLVIALALLGVLFMCFRSAVLKRLGGFTGDTLGAWVELAELVLLLVVLTHH